MTLPDIFAYDDYHVWLADWFQARQDQGAPVRLVDFAAVAGCSSGHVRNVVTGRRPLRGKLVHGFCRALDLEGPSTERFVELVALEETPESDRGWALEQLRRRATPPPARAEPLMAALVAALRSAGLEVDARALAGAVRPAVPLAAAQDALAAGIPDYAALRGCGLAEVTASAAPEAMEHLSAAIRHARAALVDLPLEENRHHVMTWAAPDDVRERWLEAVDTLVREIAALCEEARASNEPMVVYELLLQLFPLSETVADAPDATDPS